MLKMVVKKAVISVFPICVFISGCAENNEEYKLQFVEELTRVSEESLGLIDSLFDVCNSYSRLKLIDVDRKRSPMFYGNEVIKVPKVIVEDVRAKLKVLDGESLSCSRLKRENYELFSASILMDSQGLSVSGRSAKLIKFGSASYDVFSSRDSSPEEVGFIPAKNGSQWYIDVNAE